MAVLTTDSAFKKHVKKVVSADRRDLWRELLGIGQFLVIVGARDEALRIWQFAYGGMAPMPDPDDRNISVFGEGAISAVCQHLNLPDLTHGIPAPNFGSRDHRIVLRGTLGDRVQALERICRQRITTDCWSGCDWGDNPLPVHVATGIIQEARRFAQPPGEKPFSAKESRALKMLASLFANRPTFEALHPCHQAESLLLAADIAARHQQADDAVEYLRQWHDCSLSWDYNLGEAFGLMPVVGLLCDGVLADKHKLPVESCAELVDTLIAELTARLSIPEPPPAPVRKLKFRVQYGQFYLEPLKRNLDRVYFQADGEAEQGFSWFPGQVAIGTPGADDECHLELKFATRVPAMGKAVQAVVFPLSVAEPGGLFVRTVLDDGNRNHLDVPAGTYDVFASFQPSTRPDPMGFGSFKVVLTFLPGGSAPAKCLKAYEQEAPATVFLND